MRLSDAVPLIFLGMTCPLLAFGAILNVPAVDIEILLTTGELTKPVTVTLMIASVLSIYALTLKLVFRYTFERRTPYEGPYPDHP